MLHFSTFVSGFFLFLFSVFMPTEQQLVYGNKAYDFQFISSLRPSYLHLNPRQCLTFLAYVPYYIYKPGGPIEVGDPCNYVENQTCLADLFEDHKDEENVLVSLSEEMRNFFDNANARAEEKKQQWDIVYANVRKVKAELKTSQEELQEIRNQLQEVKKREQENIELAQEIKVKLKQYAEYVKSNMNGLQPPPASLLCLQLTPSDQSVLKH